MGGSFDSANYLRGLGWSGPGSSLNGSAHGRAKPVTVVQKKTLAGVGRDRDTSFAWWDAIFTSVASKVGGDKKNEQQRLTSTGILSHRPPAAQGNAYEPSSSTASGSRLNLDAMAAAKIEYARRQLYSGFLRGSTLKPAEEAESVPPAAVAKGKENAPPVSSTSEGSSKKRKRDEDGEGEGEKGSKAERKEERRKRKEEKAAKKAAKEEKRAAKARKEKGKGKEEVPTVTATAVTVQEDGDVVLVDAVEVSTTTTPPAESDPSSSKLSKEDRRAAKRLRKSLASLAPPSLPSTSSTVPRDYLSPEEAIAAEEQAYLEAKEAARRAEKEERRLEKVVKKALKEKEREKGKKKDKA